MLAFDHLTQLRQHEEQFREAGARVVVVSFETAERARAMRDRLQSPFLWLTDPQRRIYRAYGARRPSLWRSLTPQTLAGYFRALLRGHLPQKPGSDVAQNGGDYVIGAKGTLRLVHPSAHNADQATMGELLAAARGR